MKNNSSATTISFLVILLCLLISHSMAAAALSIITIMLGCTLGHFISTTQRQRELVINCVLISFVTITLATLFQWLNNDYVFNLWANDDNDQYRFWLESQNSIRYSSISVIFKECIIDNIHYENGGYYFYLKMLGYVANNYLDGNHLFYQQLGTALPGILSAVFIFAIMAHYIDDEKAWKYTLCFMLLSPVITHSIGLHRDALISFFFFISIYLWQCKNFDFKIFVIQVLNAIIVLQLRNQHGLFAFCFILLSIISSKNRSKWVYLVIALLIIAINYVVFFSVVSNNLEDTNAYYNNLMEDGLSRIDSGLGRHIYSLPTPWREIAQILVLQLQFPPWTSLLSSKSIFGVIIGLLTLIVNIYWAYVFFFALISVFKKKIKMYPPKIAIGFFVFFLLLILSTSNLDLRRVISVYPLMYLVYVLSKETILATNEIRNINKTYVVFYPGLCLLYLMLSVIIG